MATRRLALGSSPSLYLAVLFEEFPVAFRGRPLRM